MKASYIITTAPTTEPVTLEQVKTHVRVLDSTYDTELTEMISRARAVAEIYCNLSIMPQVVDLYLDEFPTDGMIDVKKAPVYSVTYVKYYDADNALQTLSTDYYNTDLVSKPARIQVTDAPSTYDRVNAVNIQFVAGYANAAAVPLGIKQAILMLIGSYFENRGDEGHRVVPDTVWKLLNQHRVKLF
jgi:uncharacterized phiE125 gp8 family phage protein